MRRFLIWAAEELGILLRFEGAGTNEVAVAEEVRSDLAPAVRPGQVIMRIDPRYFRPAEVETLLGDPSRARERLGWRPEIGARAMCAEMVAEDLKTARRHRLLKEHGLALPVSIET